MRWKTHGIVNVVFNPLIWTVHPTKVGELSLFELSVPILELLLIALVVVSAVRAFAQRRKLAVFDNPKQRFLVVSIVVCYFVWVLQFDYYRYFIPIEMLSFSAIFVCLQALVTQVGWRWLVRTGMVAIALICLATELPANWGRTSWAPSYFSVSIPRGLTRQSAAFLMLGWNPDSYAVTFFPQQDYFARIDGNLPPTRYVNGVIAREIAAYRHVYIIWDDPIQPLTSAGFMDSAQSSTAQFGLQVDWKQCVQFPAMVGTESQRFHVCPVSRTQGASRSRV